MTFEIYQSWTIFGKRWFWRLKAKNNKTVAVGGEGYHNLGDVYDTIDAIAQSLVSAQIKEKKL
jgi:uncharacterized protein YegP (UPF0339 family)